MLPLRGHKFRSAPLRNDRSPEQPPWATLELMKLFFWGKSRQNKENNTSRSRGHPLITNHMSRADLLFLLMLIRIHSLFHHFVIIHPSTYLITSVSHTPAFMPHEGRVVSVLLVIHSQWLASICSKKLDAPVLKKHF